MAIQIVGVNDAAPGACEDVGVTYNGSTTLTSTKIIAGTSMTMSGTTAITGNTTIGGTMTIDGYTTIDDILVVTGNVALDAQLTVAEGVDLIETLAVGGITSHANAVAFGAVEKAAANGAWVVPTNAGYQGFTTNSTGALAGSLADGTVGQRLVLKMTLKDTNNCVITPANLNGGTTITFDATGEYAELMFVGTGWTVLHTTATVA